MGNTFFKFLRERKIRVFAQQCPITSSHAAKDTAFGAERNIRSKCMQWPSANPDLNPTEIFQAMVKKGLG